MKMITRLLSFPLHCWVVDIAAIGMVICISFNTRNQAAIQSPVCCKSRGKCFIKCTQRETSFVQLDYHPKFLDGSQVTSIAQCLASFLYFSLLPSLSLLLDERVYQVVGTKSVALGQTIIIPFGLIDAANRQTKKKGEYVIRVELDDCNLFVEHTYDRHQVTVPYSWPSCSLVTVVNRTKR